MSGILMIRHGQASFGRQNYDQLSDLGRRQAQILGDYLHRLGFNFSTAYSGTMNRQTETARLVLSRFPETQPPLNITPELNEYDSWTVMKAFLPGLTAADPGLAEARDRMYEDARSFQQVFEPAMLRWISGRYDVPGLETWRDFTGRVAGLISGIIETQGPGRTIAVFTSGGPISAVVQMALETSDQVTLRLNWGIRNASVSVFKYNARQVFLSSYNSVAHLEQQGDPALLTYR